MKAKRVFVTIDFDNVPGKFDYPQNVPIPRVGENVVFQTYDCSRCRGGEVYEVRHVTTYDVTDITIKVRS